MIEDSFLLCVYFHYINWIGRHASTRTTHSPRTHRSHSKRSALGCLPVSVSMAAVASSSIKICTQNRHPLQYSSVNYLHNATICSPWSYTAYTTRLSPLPLGSVWGLRCLCQFSQVMSIILSFATRHAAMLHCMFQRLCSTLKNGDNTRYITCNAILLRDKLKKVFLVLRHRNCH